MFRAHIPVKCMETMAPPMIRPAITLSTSCRVSLCPRKNRASCRAARLAKMAMATDRTNRPGW
ncbi:hypothetical protein D3C84_1226430 [compost metagenome]